MSEHYYTKDPVSEHHIRRFTASLPEAEAVFETDSGVFSKQELDDGTRLLIESVAGRMPQGARVLDLGCGWGAVGIFLKRLRPDVRVVMTDINRRAADLAERNARLNGVDAEVVSGDGFECVEGCFDCIVSNPPIRAGKKTIYALFEESIGRLSPEGWLAVVIRKQQGAPSALKALETIAGQAEIIAKKKGYWVIVARRKAL